MKKLIFICILCLGCLKAQKSPFDISNPAGHGMFGALGISISGSNSSSNSDTYTLTSLSYTPSTVVFAANVIITNMVPIVTGTPEAYSISPIGSLPAGLSFDTTTGIISGTPTTVYVTPIPFTITATSSTSSVTANITLSVNVAPPGSFSYAGTGTGVTCQCGAVIPRYTFTRTVAASLALSASGATSFSISPSLPSGLSLSVTDGTISGTPTVAQTTFTLYTITATNVSGNATAQIYIMVRPVIYAATWGGGLGISTDGGASYSLKTYSSNGLGCDSINQVFINSSGVIYTANGQCNDAGISTSTDNGANFSTTMLSPNYQVTSLATPSASTIYAGALHTTNSLSGLYISTDSGSNFTQVSQTYFDSYHIQDIIVSGTTVYVANGLGAAGGISISTDGGASFTKRNNSNSGLPAASVNSIFVIGSTIYAATNSGLYISTNSGALFSISSLAVLALKVIVAPNGTIYVATSGNGLAMSSNGGASFNYKTTANGLSCNTINNVFAYQDGTVYVANSNFNIPTSSACGGGVSISSDNGSTFATYASGLSPTNIQDIYVK